MHPLLGNFVSENFYKSYGEGFDSPLGPEKFTHKLPFVSGKAAVWCDVPHDEGDSSATHLRQNAGLGAASLKTLQSAVQGLAFLDMDFGHLCFPPSDAPGSIQGAL